MDETFMNENGKFSEFIQFDKTAKRSLVELDFELAYFAKKRLVASIVGVLLLALFGPMILLLMLLVRLTSHGPAIFRQRRLGKEGLEFDVYKIRTMYVDAEILSGPKLAQPGDSRITPVGRLLRFLHLDELPQLVNVARGEMCLVGPRPERPEIIELNKLNAIPGFRERTKVLPGVTGLAQINLKADQTTDCVVPKVLMDLKYIETASFSLDLRILLCTAMRMFGVRHGRAVKMFGLFRKVSLGQDLPKKRSAVDLGHKLKETFSRSDQLSKELSVLNTANAEAYENQIQGNSDKEGFRRRIAGSTQLMVNDLNDGQEVHYSPERPR